MNGDMLQRRLPRSYSPWLATMGIKIGVPGIQRKEVTGIGGFRASWSSGTRCGVLALKDFASAARGLDRVVPRPSIVEKPIIVRTLVTISANLHSGKETTCTETLLASDTRPSPAPAPLLYFLAFNARD